MVGGAKEYSPRCRPANFHYNQFVPNPSQTPQVKSSAKKLNAVTPIGFANLRPSTAAYGKNNKNSKRIQKPLANNNGRIYR